MKTFLNSGGLGDIIYSLPTIKKMGGGILYVKRNFYLHPYGDQYEVIRDLLLQQEYIHDVCPYPGNYPLFEYNNKIQIDYDLDKARIQQGRCSVHHVVTSLNTFNQESGNWEEPWITIDEEDRRHEQFYLIHLTSRWRNNSEVDWKRVYNSIPGKAYFIGFGYEHLDFILKYGDIEHFPTSNLLEVARLIRDCQALYCNQSVSLTIAQGLGKKYFLENNPGKVYCLTQTPNENILI